LVAAVLQLVSKEQLRLQQTMVALRVLPRYLQMAELPQTIPWDLAVLAATAMREAMEVLPHQAEAVGLAAQVAEPLAESVLTQIYLAPFLCTAAVEPGRVEIQEVHLPVVEAIAIHL
jgi:hypothetical protein